MTSQAEKHTALPVAGYTPQSDDKVATVNINKQLEEQLLRRIEELVCRDDTDQRWLAIGKTHIEQGFMAINRAIFKPERIALPSDAAEETAA